MADLPRTLQNNPAVLSLQARLGNALKQSRTAKAALGDAASVKSGLTTALGGGTVAYALDRVAPGYEVLGLPVSALAAVALMGLGVAMESPMAVNVGGGVGACAVRDVMRSRIG